MGELSGEDDWLGGGAARDDAAGAQEELLRELFGEETPSEGEMFLEADRCDSVSIWVLGVSGGLAEVLSQTGCNPSR